MAISYNPKDASSSWPEGDYDGYIATVEEAKSSKDGSDMWKMGVKVFNAEGRERTVQDFIVVPKTLFRLKQIAQALGKGEAFKAGSFTPYDALEARMTVTLGIQEASGNYDEKNNVKKYSAAVVATPARQPAMAGSPISSTPAFKDSDIAF